MPRCHALRRSPIGGIRAVQSAGSSGYPSPMAVDPLQDPLPPTHGMTPSPSLWRNGAFVRVWSAAGVSIFGSLVTRLALPFVAILTLSAGPLEIALLRGLDLGATLVFGFVAGAWVDRLRRRPVLIWADLGRAVLLGSIPVAAIGGWLSLAQLLLVATLAAVLTTFFDVADNAYLPTVVTRGELVRANSVLTATGSVAEFVAFGAVGFLVNLFTAPIAIAIDAVSFLLSAGLLGSIRRPEPPPPPAADREPVGREIRAGLRVVAGDPVLRGLVWATMGIGLHYGIGGATWLLFVTRDLSLDPAVIGIVAALGGVGALAGAVLAERLVTRFGLGLLLGSSLLIAALGQLLTPLAPAGFVALAVAMLIGNQLVADTAATVFEVTEVSVRQARVEERQLGRVNATVHVSLALAELIGIILGGLLAEALGLRLALLVAPAFTALGGWLLLRSPVRGLRSLDDTSTAGPASSSARPAPSE
jgi:MFS family permease